MPEFKKPLSQRPAEPVRTGYSSGLQQQTEPVGVFEKTDGRHVFFGAVDALEETEEGCSAFVGGSHFKLKAPFGDVLAALLSFEPEQEQEQEQE